MRGWALVLNATANAGVGISASLDLIDEVRALEKELERLSVGPKGARKGKDRARKGGLEAMSVPVSEYPQMSSVPHEGTQKRRQKQKKSPAQWQEEKFPAEVQVGEVKEEDEEEEGEEYTLVVSGYPEHGEEEAEDRENESSRGGGSKAATKRKKKGKNGDISAGSGNPRVSA